MKITKQLIAAASFSSLLFAPLAQAQTTAGNTGNTELRVVEPALIITASDMEFGAVIPGGAPSDLVLTCDSNTSASAAIADGEASGNAACGVISVTATRDASFNLTLKATVLTNASNSSDTISPEFTLFSSDGGTANGTDPNGIAGLIEIAAGSAVATSTSPQTIVNGNQRNFILGGKANIAKNQGTGFYRGEYTVAAVVQ